MWVSRHIQYGSDQPVDKGVWIIKVALYSKKGTMPDTCSGLQLASKTA